ncbi:MAG TPA: ATP-binding protein [Steroidobacteraceae bacterium]|nr:ATP-binding protein [Steroidobacteraceae bacterium]
MNWNQLNANRKAIFISLAIAIAVACFFIFEGIYQEAKSAAIAKLNQQEMIYARQAARGIEDYFATWTGNLNALSKMNTVVADDREGKAVLKLFYETNQARIMEISRVDEKGVIRDDFPDSNAVGLDISSRKHIIALTQERKPVISEVFRTIDGIDSIALHVPVLQGGEFKGSVEILVDFKNLAKRYLDVIKVGETGYAWVISEAGTILYTPVPGLIGKSILEANNDDPSSGALVTAMLQGREGTAEFIAQRIGARHVRPMREYAVYVPVRLGNTFWSIGVASSEEDVLADLTTFRNRLAVAVGILFIVGVVLSTLGARAWLIVKEQEKNAQAELEIARQRTQLTQLSRLGTLGELSGSIAHEISQPLSASLSNAHAAQLLLAQPEPDLEEVREILRDIVADDQRAVEVIRRLRQLFKRGEVQLQPLSVNETVEEMLKLLRTGLIERGVTVHAELASNLPVLQGDQVELQQVLINLVSNACDAMADMPGEARVVTIRTGLDGNDFVLISICDAGPGIAEEKLEKVFEPFFTSKVNGLGLGLSVCRTIINAHGGKLWAERNSGRGATFHLRLPVRPPRITV